MRVEEVALGDWVSGHKAETQGDPLRVGGLLVESYPLGVRVEPLRGSVLVLLDCRFCDGILGNTAVLIARNSTSFEWTGEGFPNGGQWTITDWSPKFGESGWSLVVHMGRKSEGIFSLESQSAMFVSGDVAGADGAPPDLTEPNWWEQSGFQGWSSEFTPIHVWSS